MSMLFVPVAASQTSLSFLEASSSSAVTFILLIINTSQSLTLLNASSGVDVGQQVRCPSLSIGSKEVSPIVAASRNTISISAFFTNIAIMPPKTNAENERDRIRLL